MTVPFKTIFIVLLLFAVVCVPLHVAGTLLGRRAASEKSFPCRVHHLKRPISTACCWHIIGKTRSFGKVFPLQGASLEATDPHCMLLAHYWEDAQLRKSLSLAGCIT